MLKKFLYLFLLPIVLIYILGWGIAFWVLAALVFFFGLKQEES